MMVSTANIPGRPFRIKVRKGSAPKVAGFYSATQPQNAAAAYMLAVAGTLLALSLSHLAAGIALVTGAIGIDLGFIALELAVFVAPRRSRRRFGLRHENHRNVRRWVRWEGDFHRETTVPLQTGNACGLLQLVLTCTSRAKFSCW